MKIRKPMFFLFRAVAKLLWETRAMGLPLVHKVFKFLYEHLRPREPVVIEVEGNKMYVDPADLSFSLTLGLSRNSYKWFWRDLCKKEVKSGMTVIDLGAHVGFFTLLFAKLVGDEGKVFAFEPDPDNYALLTRNIALNGYNNVVAIQKAVSNGTGQLKLFLNDYTSRNDSLYSSNGETQKFVMIETISLDEFFKDLPIDFIKVNIEGAEMAFLQGASKIINGNKNLKMLLEAHVEGLRGIGVSPEEFLDKLTRYRFKLYSIYQKEKPTEPSSVASLLKEYSGRKFIHVLCVKGE